MDTPGSIATRAVISRSTLEQCASAAVTAGGEIADLRRDAYGHGLIPVARAVLAAGAHSVRVDSDDQVAALRAEGLDGTVTRRPDIDVDVLYGLPTEQSASRPVLRLTGSVVSLKNLRQGEAVSYGYSHRATADTTVALVSGGYAQAIVRALGNHAHVEVRGRLRPIIGRIAMDVCVVDVGSDHPQVMAGDEVTYFGGNGPAQNSLREWSAITGLSTAELVCAAGLRATRAEEG